MTTPPPASGKAPAPAQPKEEEEDLNELDDLLDQFTPAPSSVPPTTKPTAASTNPASDAFSDDFEAALAREMEAMMRGAEGPSGPSSKPTEEIAAAWQKMLIGELEGTNDPESLDDLLKSFDAGPGPSTSTSAAPAPSSSAPAADDAFQQTIRQAMDKLKESDANARSETETESFAQLLKQLGEMG
ncbi:hypothetical protein FRC08_004870, partial [Ceratobasidium sp. 394]